MVFGSLRNGLNLFLAEPRSQLGHFPYDASAFEMVRLSVHLETEVVAGGGHIDHRLRDFIMGGQVQRP